MVFVVFLSFLSQKNKKNKKHGFWGGQLLREGSGPSSWQLQQLQVVNALQTELQKAVSSERRRIEGSSQRPYYLALFLDVFDIFSRFLKQVLEMANETHCTTLY